MKIIKVFAKNDYLKNFSYSIPLSLMFLLALLNIKSPVYAENVSEKKDTVILAGVANDAYDVVVTTEVLKRSGYMVTFKELPWVRCIKALRDGSADVLSNVFKNSERMEFMYYVEEPFIYFKQYLYAKKDTSFTFNGDIDEIKELLIGTRIGFSYGRVFDDAIENKILKVSRVNEAVQNTKKLILGRIDLMIENPMNLILDLKDVGEERLLNEIKELKPAISSQPTFITISKKSHFGKDLVLSIDKNLNEIKKDGTYSKIMSELFGDYDFSQFLE